MTSVPDRYYKTCFQLITQTCERKMEIPNKKSVKLAEYRSFRVPVFSKPVSLKFTKLLCRFYSAKGFKRQVVKIKS